MLKIPAYLAQCRLGLKLLVIYGTRQFCMIAVALGVENIWSPLLVASVHLYIQCWGTGVQPRVGAAA